MIRITAFDALRVPQEPARLSALVERRWMGLLRQPLANVAVEFCSGDRRIGIVRTDLQGFARLDSRPDLPSGSYRVVSDRGACAEAHAFVWNSSDPILVCDLDLTLSNASALRFWLSPISQVRPFEGAPDVLRRLARTHRVVYLTARRDLVLDKTRQWLSQYLCPPGPILCRPWSLFPPAPGPFKQDALNSLRRRFSNLAAGIGDRRHDAAAYRSAGIPAILFRPRFRAPEASAVCQSWPEIEQFLAGAPPPDLERPQ